MVADKGVDELGGAQEGEEVELNASQLLGRRLEVGQRGSGDALKPKELY